MNGSGFITEHSIQQLDILGNIAWAKQVTEKNTVWSNINVQKGKVKQYLHLEYIYIYGYTIFKSNKQMIHTKLQLVLCKCSHMTKKGS